MKKKNRLEGIHLLVKKITSKLNKKFGLTNVLSQYISRDELENLYNNKRLLITDTNSDNPEIYRDNIIREINKQLDLVNLYFNKNESFKSISYDNVNGEDDDSYHTDYIKAIYNELSNIYGYKLYKKGALNRENKTNMEDKIMIALDVECHETKKALVIQSIIAIVIRCYEEYEGVLEIFSLFLDKRYKFLNELLDRCNDMNYTNDLVTEFINEKIKIFETTDCVDVNNPIIQLTWKCNKEKFEFLIDVNYNKIFQQFIDFMSSNGHVQDFRPYSTITSYNSNISSSRSENSRRSAILSGNIQPFSYGGRQKNKKSSKNTKTKKSKKTRKCKL
jgi:hypothetical protein